MIYRSLFNFLNKDLMSNLSENSSDTEVTPIKDIITKWLNESDKTLPLKDSDKLRRKPIPTPITSPPPIYRPSIYNRETIISIFGMMYIYSVDPTVLWWFFGLLVLNMRTLDIMMKRYPRFHTTHMSILMGAVVGIIEEPIFWGLEMFLETFTSQNKLLRNVIFAVSHVVNYKQFHFGNKWLTYRQIVFTFLLGLLVTTTNNLFLRCIIHANMNLLSTILLYSN